ncbi:virion structural protein [Betalipothrixvirus uzonense]|uniref:Viral structural protein n=1 Tax=Betalipothrixvirus uzonense TaxID=512792 RepID=B2CRI9_9VIRU|nr:virion structural protein [Acidianus filamentous virus 9]ACB37246.1 viral structural protein [Acidianus filamentous virus 9]
MKVILSIDKVLYEEKECSEFLECLEIYMKYLTEYGKQLGLCYGNNYSNEFPIPGEYKNKCLNGYVEIVR